MDNYVLVINSTDYYQRFTSVNDQSYMMNNTNIPAGQISEASNLSNYRKGGVNKQLENIGDVQRRGREIEATGKELGKVFM